jgi:hypothetical protein
MQSLAFLPLGFVIGMGHALETDHLAAVSNMLAKKGNHRAVILRGAFWGLGHTLSLFVICSAVVVLGLTISGTIQATVEFAVGVMIVALGVQTLRVMIRDRVHAHVHQHGETAHLHLHSHAGETLPHAKVTHDHEHRATNIKALCVGLLHGAAGSGALLVMTISATDSILQALVYFAVFGLGSLVGMATLSTVASFPLILAQRGATWLKNGTMAAIGLVAMFIGATIMIENGTILAAVWN